MYIRPWVDIDTSVGVLHEPRKFQGDYFHIIYQRS